jgi:hypothetical protein
MDVWYRNRLLVPRFHQWGSYDPATNSMTMSADVPEEHRAYVFLHELCHHANNSTNWGTAISRMNAAQTIVAHLANIVRGRVILDYLEGELGARTPQEIARRMAEERVYDETSNRLRGDALFCRSMRFLLHLESVKVIFSLGWTETQEGYAYWRPLHTLAGSEAYERIRESKWTILAVMPPRERSGFEKVERLALRLSPGQVENVVYAALNPALAEVDLIGTNPLDLASEFGNDGATPDHRLARAIGLVEAGRWTLGTPLSKMLADLGESDDADDVVDVFNLRWAARFDRHPLLLGLLKDLHLRLDIEREYEPPPVPPRGAATKNPLEAPITIDIPGSRMPEGRKPEDEASALDAARDRLKDYQQFDAHKNALLSTALRERIIDGEQADRHWAT